MRKLTNKSGFTLIEIIVVLIIVGILAAIALPNLFSNVNKSRAEEALATISSFRPTIEGCVVKQAGTFESVQCASAIVGSPSASRNFTYTLYGPANAGDTGYSIAATGVGAMANQGTIVITRSPGAWPVVSPTVTCIGTAGSSLAGAC